MTHQTTGHPKYQFTDYTVEHSVKISNLCVLKFKTNYFKDSCYNTLTNKATTCPVVNPNLKVRSRGRVHNAFQVPFH
jgi:hypothetical protein